MERESAEDRERERGTETERERGRKRKKGRGRDKEWLRFMELGKQSPCSRLRVGSGASHFPSVPSKSSS